MTKRKNTWTRQEKMQRRAVFILAVVLAMVYIGLFVNVYIQEKTTPQVIAVEPEMYLKPMQSKAITYPMHCRLEQLPQPQKVETKTKNSEDKKQGGDYLQEWKEQVKKVDQILNGEVDEVLPWWWVW